MYAENCDKSVLKRLLKQLWRIVMKSLERNVVLPPMSEKVNKNEQASGCELYQEIKGVKVLEIFFLAPIGC